ncbi:MAG: glycoside hydrolase family 92 protein, partial [Bacteroides sp.]|nr:glycoside hydrolase family 92 protein [Bacteroides sp.]
VINNSAENIYIKSAELNGQPYILPYINHSDIAMGGTLTLVMSNEP